MKNYLISLSLVCSAASLSEVHAAVQFCQTAPLLVGSKNIGSVSYYADQCDKNWENQNIRLDFSYSQKIPEWAFKRAASHFLNKNIAQRPQNSVLNHITELYRPVKKGDFYSLNYAQNSKTLSLSLNQKLLGSITNPQANQYFKIWFGSSPFSAKLKQQLLN